MITVNSDEKSFLFALVERGLHIAVTENRLLSENDITQILTNHPNLVQGMKENQKLEDVLQGVLCEKMGAFVTYYLLNSPNQENLSQKTLRGCIGHMVAQVPLWVTVAQMAYKSALEDTRFKPISFEELPRIIFDITILEPFSLCPDVSKIVLGKHGIMLEAHGRHAVFLPHVPIEQNWTLEETFMQLCYKARLPKDTWKEEATKFYWYEGLLLH